MVETNSKNKDDHDHDDHDHDDHVDDRDDHVDDHGDQVDDQKRRPDYRDDFAASQGSSGNRQVFASVRQCFSFNLNPS